MIHNERETVMAKAELKSGYEITCSGTFFATQDRNKVLRTWGPETFFLPENMTIKTGYVYKEVKVGGHPIKRAVEKKETVNSLQWASHIIQRYLLPSRLASKHKDFVRFRTCVITNTKRVTKAVDPAEDLDEKNIGTMTLEQLRTLCAIKAMPVPLDDFADIEEARIAVRNDLQNLKLAAKANIAEPAADTIEEPEVEVIGEGTITTAPVTDDDLLS
jgi:hypothetical protein